MPFGVELPENFGSPAPETQVDTSAGGQSGTQQNLESSRQAEQPETPKEILDLDKLERFRFDGKEWGPKDLKNSYLRHADYTKKTQELKEARKYSDNFTIDLEKVIENPALLTDFRAVYPKEYVERALRVLKRLEGNGAEAKSPQERAESPTAGDPQLIKKLSTLEEKLAAIEDNHRATEVEKIQSWLNNQYESLQKKYPDADPDVVDARAEIASRQGTEISVAALEKLFKASHDQNSARYEAKYKEKVQKQIEAGKKAKDSGPGGGTVGSAPKGIKTLKEAKAQMLQDFGSR